MITRHLACELASFNINVNAIGPIITKTPMTAERIKKEAARYERTLLNVPMGRLGETSGPDRSASSSSRRAASDFITGSIIYPDGGMMAFA